MSMSITLSLEWCMLSKYLGHKCTLDIQSVYKESVIYHIMEPLWFYCRAYQRRAYIVYVELCTGVMVSRVRRNSLDYLLLLPYHLVSLPTYYPYIVGYFRTTYAHVQLWCWYYIGDGYVGGESMLSIYIYVLNLQNMFSKVSFILKMVYNVSQNEQYIFSVIRLILDTLLPWPTFVCLW